MVVGIVNITLYTSITPIIGLWVVGVILLSAMVCPVLGATEILLGWEDHPH